MKKRTIIIGGAVIVGIVTWYLLRPELLFIDRVVSETLPAEAGRAAESRSVAVATGNFHSVAHESKGLATIYEYSTSARVLRLTEFETSNGPALYVYLIAKKDAADSAAVRDADFIDLGPLKGNKGDQNYELPANIDLAKYQAVSIWCRRFSVNFATAPLNRITENGAPHLLMGP